MILITTTNENRPADFLMVAQNPVTYELLGFSATGTAYTGDFSGFQARFGTTNELGSWDQIDEVTSTYVNPTVEGVTAKFNADQDKKREIAYKAEADKLLMEAWRKEIDPSSNATDRSSVKNQALAVVADIKARYPKV